MWSFTVPILLLVAALATIAGLHTLQIAKRLKENGSNQVCYDNLGCFDNGKPWTTPLPEPPEKCPVKVFFFSRQNLDDPYVISIYPDIPIEEAPFDGNRPTVVIIHGYQRNSSSIWMHKLKNIYLQNSDANVLLVDWMTAAFTEYFQSAANTRLIGRMLSRMVKVLMEEKGLQPGLIHLVGHSLGAHVCSFIAKEIPGIGRLTGLDPAQPGFDEPSPEIRIDKTDAVFVEIVHTDPKPTIPYLGYGLIGPLGHVDFYFNNEFIQPGCLFENPAKYLRIQTLADVIKFPLAYAYINILCSHERSHEYLIEAYNASSNCIFWGHRVNLTSVDFNKGIIGKLKVLSDTCTDSDCLSFGMDTVKTSLRGVFLVRTHGKEPYCIYEPGLLENREMGSLNTSVTFNND